MKKTIIISAISLVIGGLLVLLVIMSISGTRNLLLGLAPEEAILQLANQIDISREESRDNITELERIIAEQEGKIAEQEKTINEQIQSMLEVSKEAEDTEKSIANQKLNQEACFKAQELYSTVPQAKSSGDRSECHVLGPSNIVDQVKETRKHMKGSKSSECHENYYKNRLKPIYEEYLKYKELCGN